MAGIDADEQLRRFYKAHPYPAPVSDLTDYVSVWSDEGRRRPLFHLLFPDVPYRGNLDILVAGCGTSQAARQAIRWPNARLVGIDISAASLAHTDDLRREHGLDNLKTRQLAIEDVGQLDADFDLIVCTGVLHHLADPNAGLSALAGVLRSGGALHLMVYGKYGRTGVSMIQEYCRMLDVEPSTPEIDSLAETLREIPLNHPLSHILRETHDFRSYGGIADALLNPREVAYTVSELFELLQAAGLVFGRWVHQAPYRPGAGAFATTPHYERLTTLPERDQFAAMELLRGTLTRHSVIVYDEERTTSPFEDVSSTHRAIPHRLAESILVRENLPDGASAVLLNRSHHDGDLYMSLSVEEERMIEAIDGESTIGELAERLRLDVDGVAATLQRAWIGDHVVFDLSRT